MHNLWVDFQKEGFRNILKVLDLFSGIGGFSLALESSGHFETITFVEKDEFCQKVLAKNFKGIPIEGEIRNVKGKKYKADVITGGFPCQPFSFAGNRKGKDDDRYLWDETIRVIRECKPRWFIGENVEGLVNIQNGMVLRQVQDDLEEEGFEVQCVVIPASGIGAWHQRKRVWILAYSSRIGLHRQKGDATIKSCNQSKDRVSIGNDKLLSNSNSRMRGRGRAVEQGRANKVWGFYSTKEEQPEHDIRSEAVGCDAVFRKKKNEQETWWETQSRVCGVPNGVSYELDKNRAKRVKALGNSIVPQIVYEIGKAIILAELDQI